MTFCLFGEFIHQFMADCLLTKTSIVDQRIFRAVGTTDCGHVHQCTLCHFRARTFLIFENMEMRG